MTTKIQAQSVSRCSRRYHREKTLLDLSGEYRQYDTFHSHPAEYNLVLHQAGHLLFGYWAILDQRLRCPVSTLYRYFELTLKRERRTRGTLRLSFEGRMWNTRAGVWKPVTGDQGQAVGFEFTRAGAEGVLSLTVPPINPGSLAIYLGTFTRTRAGVVQPLQQRLALVPERQWPRVLAQGFRSKQRTDQAHDKILPLLRKLAGFSSYGSVSGAGGGKALAEGVKGELGRLRDCFDDNQAACYVGEVEWPFARGHLQARLMAVHHPRHGNYWEYLRVVMEFTPWTQRIHGNLGFPDPNNARYYAYRWRIRIGDKDTSGEAREYLEKAKGWLEKLAKKALKGLRKYAKFIPLRLAGTMEIRKYVSATPDGFQWDKAETTTDGGFKWNPSTAADSWTFDMQLFWTQLTAWDDFFDKGDSGWPTPPDNTVYGRQDWNGADFNSPGPTGSFAITGAGVGSARKLVIEFLPRPNKSGMSGTAILRKPVQGIVKKFKALSSSGAAGGIGDLFLMSGSSGPKVASPFRGSRRVVATERTNHTLFDEGKSSLSAKGKETIRRFCAEHLAELLAPRSEVRVYGYASYEKPDWAASDMQLSKNRACAVVDCMSAFLGTRALRVGRNLKVAGFGQQKAREDYEKRFPNGPLERDRKDKQEEDKQAEWRRVDLVLNGRVVVSYYGK